MEKILEVSLWFNSSKTRMKEKLEETVHNSGVGINISRYAYLFDPSLEYVSLEFDDGSKGEAMIKMDGRNKYTHLIDECIGAWARHNGLWKRKVNESSVKVYMKVLQSKNKYYVFQR